MDGAPISARQRAQLMGDDDPVSASRRQLHTTVEDARTLVSRLVQVDAESCDVGDLESLRKRLVMLSDELGALPTLGGGTSPAASSGPAARLNERSPVSGRTNAVAAPLVYRHEGEHTLATAIYAVQHEGPAGHVHGGMVAAAFDELLGVAQMASGAAGFTGSLSVRFHRPTPLHVPITYDAKVARRDGRKLIVAATSTDGHQQLASAEGIFIAQHELTATEA